MKLLRNLGHEFIASVDDDAIIIELLDEFHQKDKQEQDDIICFILGALGRAREKAGYGTMEIGK